MDDSKHSADAEDLDLQRKVREHRKFSLAEAIGRLGGGDLMKGASPVTAKRQAQLVVEDYLEKHLRDTEGAMEVVLCRQVTTSDTLLEHVDHPIQGLAVYCNHLLASVTSLAEFVRLVDVEWGRMYLERPRFEREGAPPADDDPYTLASVRGKLQQLLAQLNSEPPSM